METGDGIVMSSSAVRDVEERMGDGEVERKKKDEGVGVPAPGESGERDGEGDGEPGGEPDDEADGESDGRSDGESDDELDDMADGEFDSEGDGEGDTKKRDDVVEASSSDE